MGRRLQAARRGGPDVPANSTNAAKNAAVTFAEVASYAFAVTAADTFGRTTASQVSVSVAPIASTIAAAPNGTTAKAGASLQLAAVGNDQFGERLAAQPAATWSVTKGLETASPAGSFTAHRTLNDDGTVTAAAGAVRGSAAVPRQTRSVVPRTPQDYKDYLKAVIDRARNRPNSTGPLRAEPGAGSGRSAGE